MSDVFFDLDESDIRDGDRSVLQRDADWMKRWGTTIVTVEGHADSIGSEAYNLALSEHRAESVTQELSYDGVREARLTTKGYGEKYPVAPNTNPAGSDNPSGRAKNRRVEVVIAN